MWIPLDVCLLNDEGQLLYTSFLSQLHLVYKCLEVWCICAEGVLLFAWWGPFDNPAATTLDVLPHRCLQYVPKTTRRAWLFSWGHFASTQYTEWAWLFAWGHFASPPPGQHHPISSNRERNVRKTGLLLQRSPTQKVSKKKDFMQKMISMQDWEIHLMVD